ncbi:MAG: PAS domain S-box protein [Verrucomicrobia bacterium]|nr:PAS domain S-box protein [Verrucomicrobiota bacterium]
MGAEKGWDSLAPWLPILPLTLFRQDFDGSFRFVTAHIETWTGMSSEEWVEGVDFWESVHEADRDRVREHLGRTREGAGVESLEYRLRLPGASRVIWVGERRRVALTRGQPDGFEGSWVDITTRRMAELRMAPGGWQQTLASMTPGVAHDLNNHFASILALSDNFVRKTPPDHPFSEGFRTIRDSVQQAARLLQRLITLHLGRSGDRRYHNLDELLDDTLDFLRHTIPRRIGFHVQFAPGRLPVYLDAVEFRKAFISLVKNGVDAIPNPGAGSIRFSSRWSAEPPAGMPDPLPRHARGYVGISVADSGMGVSETDRDRLFQPWFSTKSPTEGSGLALHAVRRFARECGGEVAYEPSAGGGSCFTLWLPVSDLTEADQFAQARSQVVYVAGPGSETDDAAGELRSWGLRVVVTDQSPMESLLDEDVAPDAVILLRRTDPSWLPGLARLIRNRRWNTKIICERSGDSPFPDADVVVRPDLSLPAPVAGPVNHARLRSLLLASPG